MPPIISVTDLTHVYSAGTPFEHIALHNLSFSAEPGELIGIIGHTGSGKSTLVQHLNGLLKPTSGTCFKDIAFGPKNQGISGAELEQRVYRAAGFVGLDRDLLEKSPFDLSGGQKRRVAIAGVIAMEPEVLILDEPTAGLDAEGRESILKNIRDYRDAQNATVIMVSHSMEEVARICGRLVVMHHGEITMDGTPGEVFTQAQRLKEIGLSVPLVTEVFRLLRSRGVDVPENTYTLRDAVAILMKLKGGIPEC